MISEISIIGWLHSAACVAAMLAFLPVIVRRKGGAAHRWWGTVFALAYVAVCLTSLGIYAHHRFWFPHVLAIAGLVVITIGWCAARFRPPGWRYIHLIAMLLSAYNLFGGAVNEAFLRLPALRAATGGNFASPLVGMAHGYVMLGFILLIIIHCALTAVRGARKPKLKPALEGGAS